MSEELSQAATCSCSPRIYNWTLSFNETCPETLPINDGLSSDSECRIQRRNMNPAVKAHTIRFLEYGENLGDLVQYKILKGMWEEDDVISFESVTNNNIGIMPSAAAFEIDATTANNTNVQLQWLVAYTNACGVDPYENISNIAWMNFKNLGPADETCYPCDITNPKSSKSGKSEKSIKNAKQCKRTAVRVKSPKSIKTNKNKASKGKSAS